MPLLKLVPPTQVPLQFQEGKIDKHLVPPLIFLQGQVLRTKMLMLASAEVFSSSCMPIATSSKIDGILNITQSSSQSHMF